MDKVITSLLFNTSDAKFTIHLMIFIKNNKLIKFWVIIIITIMDFRNLSFFFFFIYIKKKIIYILLNL